MEDDLRYHPLFISLLQWLREYQPTTLDEPVEEVIQYLTQKVNNALDYEMRLQNQGLPEDIVQELVFESLMPSDVEEADKPFPRMKFQKLINQIYQGELPTALY